MILSTWAKTLGSKYHDTVQLLNQIIIILPIINTICDHLIHMAIGQDCQKCYRLKPADLDSLNRLQIPGLSHSVTPQKGASFTVKLAHCRVDKDSPALLLKEQRLLTVTITFIFEMETSRSSGELSSFCSGLSVLFPSR